MFTLDELVASAAVPLDGTDLLRRLVAARTALPGPGDVAADKDAAEQMRRALGRLGDDQAQVLTLRFVAGLSTAEVGVVLGKSQGSVRALQHRGVASLKASCETTW